MGMVRKIIQEIIDLPQKMVRGNYQLFEKNVWPQKDAKRAEFKDPSAQNEEGK
jgi:hypothetical protein